MEGLDHAIDGFIGVSPIDHDEPMAPNCIGLTAHVDSHSVDRRRDSEILTAEFLRNLAGNKVAAFHRHGEHKELSRENAKHMKELEFLSQKLSNDVASKTESIANLSTANTVLLEQMQKMKAEMERMHSRMHHQNPAAPSVFD